MIHLFEAFGVELEYMIVDRDSLDVTPICDRVLFEVAGQYLSEVELGEISWSNELALHVIELKTTEPTADLAGAATSFQQHVERINDILRPHHACLMPTAMHPWMDPDRELKLWPHEYNAVYESFHRIFNCRGHGWANLQSVHLNLPFAGDDEFARLHAAIRVLLPIMPALAASSPVLDARLTGMCDTRLEVYRANQQRIPSITGLVIPEPVFSRHDYDEHIFQQIYRDIAPHDPEGILQFEWLNARGAIARFDRNAIEIRVLDVQECPAADVAICTVIARVLQGLAEERWSSLAEQKIADTERLAQILRATIREADGTSIDDAAYLQLFGLDAQAPMTAGAVWQQLAGDALLPSDTAPRRFLETIANEGSLARRISNRLRRDESRQSVAQVYQQLCQCLAEGHVFDGPT